MLPIAESWRGRLDEYLGGTVDGLGGFSLGVGGVSDHVHLLVGLKATHCLADLMRELKKATSAWVHEEIQCREFAWEEGHSVFTVSPPARPKAQKSSENQAEHHFLVKPEGLQANSRWLSGATPPVMKRRMTASRRNASQLVPPALDIFRCALPQTKSSIARHFILVNTLNPASRV